MAAKTSKWGNRKLRIKHSVEFFKDSNDEEAVTLQVADTPEQVATTPL